jgi:hypothetical protein
MGRPKKKRQEDLFEPTYRFSDITILEAQGEYKECRRILKECGSREPWCLRSKLTIIHPFGVCDMELEFHSDRRLRIISCRPSTSEPVANYDLRCLRQWVEANNWKIPVPSKHVIESDINFWKHMWDVTLIDSEFFDERYGDKEAMYFEEEEDEDFESTSSSSSSLDEFEKKVNELD